MCSDIDWFQLIITNFILPVFIGSVAFFASNAISNRSIRKRQSIVGAAILESFCEELNNGIKLMKLINSFLSGTSQLPGPLPKNMPTGSWSGINTSITDEYLERIICTSKGIKPVSHDLKYIRIHLKNYFENICGNFNSLLDLMNSNQQWQQKAEFLFNPPCDFINASENVLKMVKQAQELLLRNYKGILPK